LDSGAQVALTATASPGFRFAGWTGSTACAGTAPQRTLSPTTSLACTASFVRQVRVSVAASSNGGAMLTAPGCTSHEACLVDAGRPVLFSAPPARGFRFMGWIGAGCPTQATGMGDTAVAGKMDLACTANFVKP